MGLYQPSPPQPVLLQALILAFLISTERDQNLETCSFCSERSRKWSRVSRQRGFQSSQAWPCLEWAQVFLICSHFLAIAGWLLSWPKEGGGGCASYWVWTAASKDNMDLTVSDPYWIPHKWLLKFSYTHHCHLFRYNYEHALGLPCIPSMKLIEVNPDMSLKKL